MAEDDIDGILVRLDKIEKLQAELRHLVPRVTSDSSGNVRHQDPSRDTSASIRFPSLFTFPVISNFTSPKSERVQKSAAQLNLSNKLSNGNRSSAVNLRNAGSSSQSGSFARETNIFKDLFKNANNVTKSCARNSSVLTSVTNSKTPTTPMKGIIANRAAKQPQETIRKKLKKETSRIAVRGKTQRVINERSNMQLSKNEDNANSICSSVQTSGIQVHTAGTAGSCDMWSCLRRNRHRDRSLPMKGLIERIIEKLNYCLVDDDRVTVPYHHPGDRTPTRIQVTNSRNEEQKLGLQAFTKLSVN